MATVKPAPLNCIVDDSALVASVRSGAPHSIRPWLAQDAINVFVPISGKLSNLAVLCIPLITLHIALDRLNALRRIKCPVRNDAHEALKWLDDITTLTSSKRCGRVELQGPEDQYSSWQDVERYLLPETPLSRSNGHGQDRVDAVSKMLDRNLNMDSSPSSSTKTQETKRSLSASPTTSASSLSSNNVESTMKADESSSTLSAHGIPPVVQPLLNFVVWRTHYQEDIDNGAEKYILVTNDPIIQKQASKFGVRVKLLSQLSAILAKEGLKPEMPEEALPTDTIVNGHDVEGEEGEDISDDEDRVVFDPSKRPGSSRGFPPIKTQQQTANVIDPDHFGRDDKIPAIKSTTPTGPANNLAQRASRGNFNVNRGNGQAHLSPPRQQTQVVSQPGPQRGRGGNTVNGRGTNLPHRGNARVQTHVRGVGHHGAGRASTNVPMAPRGNSTFRGRANTIPFTPRGGTQNTPRNQFIQKPIDPDSFARPTPFGRGRGRGAAMHRLWEPTSSG